MGAPAGSRPATLAAAAAALADAGQATGNAVGLEVTVELSRVLVAAATRALDAVRVDRGRGALAEAQADVADLQAGLSDVLARAEAWLGDRLHTGLAEALGRGWEAGIREQDASLPASVSLSSAEVPNLESWPILGHTAAELARHHAALWRFAAEGVLGAAAATGAPAMVVPGLADAAKAAGNRAAAATAEAFQSGAGAARLATGEALRRGT